MRIVSQTYFIVCRVESFREFLPKSIVLRTLGANCSVDELGNPSPSRVADSFGPGSFACRNRLEHVYIHGVHELANWREKRGV